MKVLKGMNSKNRYRTHKNSAIVPYPVHHKSVVFSRLGVNSLTDFYSPITISFFFINRKSIAKPYRTTT